MSVLDEPKGLSSCTKSSMAKQKSEPRSTRPLQQGDSIAKQLPAWSEKGVSTSQDTSVELPGATKVVEAQ